MTRLLFTLIATLFLFSASSQKTKSVSATQTKKTYPSLLWEITGNGLKTPSYLFGTMHVSNKLAFHLGDSFYNALKAVQVVALETNPEFWQEDFSRSLMYGKGPLAEKLGEMFGRSNESDELSISTFALDKFESGLKAALAMEPSMINGLLYRTNGMSEADFEEDTYLDLYLFQAGKKLGKRLSAVENFHESEKLIMQGYQDMNKESKRKQRSMDYESMASNPKKIEDAYRRGDLDMLDSLQNLYVTSDAFNELFLYKRNEIQAKSIDTILKNNSLFVAVGAAHLPGRRGVIEMLREMGYTLRPISMDQRNSNQKETIDKIHFASAFSTQKSEDGFYSVQIPGDKFYRFTDDKGSDVVQHADMINGAYYMVSRIRTNSQFSGSTPAKVHHLIDSLLYENIPGKLVSKKAIEKNGFSGWEIQNKTRRGDEQRYQVFITPHEVIIFKVSGSGDFVTKTRDAEKFFSSITLSPLAKATADYSPASGGFAVRFPHQPSITQDKFAGTGRFEYGATDAQGNSFIVMHKDFHPYFFAEEDSFDLGLLEESYNFSTFIKERIKKSWSSQNGYPALDATYKHQDGSFSQARYIVRGSRFYVLAARYTKENSAVKDFFKSFNLQAYKYPALAAQSDSLLSFTATYPQFSSLDDSDKRLINEWYSMINRFNEEEDEERYSYRRMYKSKVISNEGTGEQISIQYWPSSPYRYRKDSSMAYLGLFGSQKTDKSSFIYKVDKRYQLPNGTWVRQRELTDTGSSRLILWNLYERNGHLYSVKAVTDTQSTRSAFISNFFQTFSPADTLKGSSVFIKKSQTFLQDFFNPDSLISKKAIRAKDEIEFDSTDLALLKSAITRVNWGTKNYIETKKFFIEALGETSNPEAIPYLKDLYLKIGDTTELQESILRALINQRTKESFAAYKELMLSEPPITSSYYSAPQVYQRDVSDNEDEETTTISYGNGGGGHWQDLYDSLALTRTIFPDFLQLLDLDDYENKTRSLLVRLVDSNYLNDSHYSNRFMMLYNDARHALKKQLASEEGRNMRKLAQKDKGSRYADDDEDEKPLMAGNVLLENYSVLLLPFMDKHTGVKPFFNQLLKSADMDLKLSTALLLIRNNKPVPDSVLQDLAKSEYLRYPLFISLQKGGKKSFFPKKYAVQESLVRSAIMSRNTYSAPDSLVYLERRKILLRGKQGYLYFYKAKKKRDDLHWNIIAYGMEPLEGDSMQSSPQMRIYNAEWKIDESLALKDQLTDLQRELVNSKRPGSRSFYRDRYTRWTKESMPDMIKQSRYRD